MSPFSAVSRMALLVSTTASMSVHAAPSCTADFSVYGQGRLAIEISQRADGAFDAVVNGVTTNAGGRVVDEKVRPQLDLGADPGGADYARFNTAERSLAHLHRVMSLAPSREFIRMPFALADVRRLKTYDLVGKTDKFGGQVLLEAYGNADVLLGRVVRRVFVAACQ